MPYLLVLTLLLVGCTQTITRTQVIMGTFCSITLEEKHAKEIDAGFQHLKEVESILSSYQSNALVSRLNAERVVATDNILTDIIEKSKVYHTQTHGYFDITVGAITKKLYRFGEEERISTLQEQSNAPLGINNIQLERKTIRLDGNITIDLGGIGKGYGVDSLSKYYQTKDINKGQIALSGDIRCLDVCEVAIQSPFEEEKILGTIHSKTENLSISTSGTYRRYVKKQKHHHLINPKTKTQGRAFVSVTIIAHKDNTLCDAMATAISTMPKAVALKFVHAQKTFGYLLVTPEKEIISGNLEKFVEFKHSPHTIENK